MKKLAQVQKEVVYGVHSVTELLRQKRRKVFAIYTLDPEPRCFSQIKALLPAYPVAIHHLSRQELAHRIMSDDHQGIAAIAALYPIRKKFFEPGKNETLVMLDGIQDIRNVGAIIRSAYCVGVTGIIVCNRGGAPLNAAAHKASAGLAERIEIFQAASASEAIQELKKAGYTIYVAALGRGKNATQITYERPLCLIIGSEGKGVSPESKQAGTVVTLPQQVDDVSYNASVAAGILMFMVMFTDSANKSLAKK